MKNMAETMWMVRAGEGGYLAEEFARGYVAIGWKELGDLNAVKTQDEIRALYEQTFPNDGGEPGHYLCWTLALYRTGQIAGNLSERRVTAGAGTVY
jgi:hypothetical protein